MSAEFVKAAEKAKVTIQRNYDSTMKVEEGQALALLALAHAMEDIATAIEGNASAVRYASR